MSASLVARIVQATAQTSVDYNRLVLVVGEASSGKTAALESAAHEFGCPRINVGVALSEALLELTQRQRRVRAPALLSQICGAGGAGTVVLDNTELLFAPSLELDPLRLLQSLSRHRTVIAAWRGTHDGVTLTYAAAGHPEARRIANPAGRVVLANSSNLPVCPSAEGSRP